MSPHTHRPGGLVSDSEQIPVERQSIAREFVDFIRYNKAWWMTPIIIVLGAMVAFILFAESSPVLPFIYTVI
jgi:hypothetical protein